MRLNNRLLYFSGVLFATTTSQCILKCVLYWHFRQPPTGWIKFENFTFRVSGLVVRGDGRLGWAHSIARPWVAISCQLTHMVYLLPFLKKNYLAGSQCVSTCPTDPDMMINGALYIEATATSSGKKNHYQVFCSGRSDAGARYWA